MKTSHVTFMLLLYLVLVFGCTSDPDTPLGAGFVEDGLIPSQPGEVSQDTVFVTAGDTSFVVNTVMLTTDQMSVGKADEIESWMMVRVDFSTAGDDTLLEVDQAWITLTMTNDTLTMGAFFIELAEPFTEGDTLTTLQLGDTIPDTTLTNVYRTLKLFPRTYPLPAQLVEDWIKGTRSHNGFAVVPEDTTTKRLTFATRENAVSGIRPNLKVVFKTGDQSTYHLSADGTFLKELSTPTDLRLSDGFARRIYVPLDMTIFDPKTLVHEAKLIFRIVPETITGEDRAVTLYAAESTDLNDPGVLTGTPVATKFLNSESDVLDFSIRNILAILLAEGGDQSAFVLRYATEGTSIRKTEFYRSSEPDSLKPSYTFTLSTAPEFDK